MKDHQTGTADQRRTSRKGLEGEVRLKVETTALVGQGDNISHAGLLFYTDVPVRVSIDVETEEGPRTFKGRLIRLQRISDASTGLAVEFDPE